MWRPTAGLIQQTFENQGRKGTAIEILKFWASRWAETKASSSPVFLRSCSIHIHFPVKQTMQWLGAKSVTCVFGSWTRQNNAVWVWGNKVIQETTKTKQGVVGSPASCWEAGRGPLQGSTNSCCVPAEMPTRALWGSWHSWPHLFVPLHSAEKMARTSFSKQAFTGLTVRSLKLRFWRLIQTWASLKDYLEDYFIQYF